MTLYYSESGIEIHHGDCREILPLIVADVLVTDPPYGINFAGQPTKWQRRAGKHAEDWDRDTIPEVPAIAARFDEAFVWGGNYYALPPSRGWLAWFKPDAPPFDGEF